MGRSSCPGWRHHRNADSERLRQLRQRLELTSLAIETGAPLTTAEVSLLLGARPGTERVERGGLVARRVSRNVWRSEQSSRRAIAPIVTTDSAAAFEPSLTCLELRDAIQTSSPERTFPLLSGFRAHRLAS